MTPSHHVRLAPEHWMTRAVARLTKEQADELMWALSDAFDEPLEYALFVYGNAVQDIARGGPEAGIRTYQRAVGGWTAPQEERRRA